MFERLREELSTIVGFKNVLHGADIDTFLTDIQGFYSGNALAVVKPASTAEVAEVVKVCTSHDVAIVPQGGNTGLCGGAVPSGDGQAIVLSLSRMNKILSVDPQCYSVTVEAGVILQSIHDAAAEVDRAFALDWGARGSAMVGGGISTNAGGLNVLRFGTTREQVLGLEVVLPNGQIWNGLRALRKDASGYDLKQLFIGSEGTLGIITKACLRLHPLQPFDQSMLGALTDLSHLMDLFSLARNIGGDALTAFELLPGEGVRRVPEVKPAISQPLETQADWCVLIRFSGRDAEELETRLLQFYQAAFESDLLSDAVVSQTLAQEKNLWHLRDEIPPEKLYDGKLIKWDVSVPINRVTEFITLAEKLVKEVCPLGRFYAFGHVGDGNLHTMAFPGVDDGPEADALCEKLYEQMDALIWSLDGSICAEHGVGIENVKRLTGQKSDIELELMRSIKTLLDPDLRLNPGKVIDA